ncbi:MAG TPA: hypothetical protein VH120_00640 [Gemmataceae bacterium]|nr:hypothetical protein [Gemmataceae bacterium]
MCLLGNIGYRLRRPLDWDPIRERFVKDAEADALIDAPLRAPGHGLDRLCGPATSTPNRNWRIL